MHKRKWKKSTVIFTAVLIAVLVVAGGLCVWFTAGQQPDAAPIPQDSAATGGGPTRDEIDQEGEPGGTSGTTEGQDGTPNQGQNTDGSTEKDPQSESGLPTPLSGKYPDMVVKPTEYIPLEEGDKVIYLTFDDGPCATTPQLLDVLDELGVKATFFVTAQFGSDEKLVAYMKEISARGHEVAVHSYSHNYKEIYASVDAFLADYKKMDDLIVQATGKRSSVFRFPGGSNAGYNKAIRTELLAEMNSRGLVYHDWNAFNGDVEGLSKDEMVKKAVKECSYKDKSVLLMHNIPGKDAVIEALPSIVTKLKEKGYRFAKLDGTVKPYQFAKAE